MCNLSGSSTASVLKKNILFPLLGLSALLIFTGCVTQQVSSSQPQSAGSAPMAERAELEGKWAFTMQNEQQGNLTGTLLVQRGGAAGYTGRIALTKPAIEAETVITKAEIKGQQFVYEGNIKTPQGPFPFQMRGTIQGAKMVGQSQVQLPDGSASFKFIATRQ